MSPGITGVTGILPCVPFDPLIRETDICDGIQVRVPEGIIEAPTSSIGTVIKEGTKQVGDAVTVSISLLSGSTLAYNVSLSHLFAAARQPHLGRHACSL